MAPAVTAHVAGRPPALAVTALARGKAGPCSGRAASALPRGLERGAAVPRRRGGRPGRVRGFQLPDWVRQAEGVALRHFTAVAHLQVAVEFLGGVCLPFESTTEPRVSRAAALQTRPRGFLERQEARASLCTGFPAPASGIQR